MSEQKTLTNEQGLFYGRYRAKVVDNKHPKGWHMAKIRLLGYWDDLPEGGLPWAEYMLSLGARKDEGDMMPTQPGDLVWVSFEEGDSRRPIIEGSVYSVDGKATGKSLLPQDAWEQTYSHKRTAKQPAAPQHAYGDKVLDQLGFLFQLTMSGEYCITHKATGTSRHINSLGDLVDHVENNQFNSTTGDRIDEIKKSLQVLVDMNYIAKILKDSKIEIGGDSNRTVEGKDVIAITGARTVSAKTIAETADLITLNGGTGVVTGECICPFTGKPHADVSSTVKAGK
ncbi:phage baseplate assembly protein V [Vibrio europaeus]|uniref:phage baseplate assembly protein V n=1 Tax=Vibrio europaeus TaxID=300876 RepID=UPI00233E9D3A|nr:phage baseplate assembly protein V [Vibrio europaeus]MDC5753607.1 phage baseplate assembly protein V [Vibrio europaeus]MDC5816480.1 phage baseplate assembly protein V [Vibrio europaeus]